MPWLIRGFKWLKVPTGVSLNASTASVWTWATYQLVATITPSWVKNNKIHRTASNNKVTVDNNGLVTWVSDWEVTVTATTDYGWFTDSCTFTVYTINVTGVSLNESEISLWAWDTYQLEATITPSDATNKNVTWRSTDASIATVDSNWLVTCVTPWECQIIVTTVDGNYTASCDVVSWYIINENTLSYFPFEEDFIDKKWNRTLTVNDCVIDNWSAKINSQSSYMQPSSTIWWSDITISVWYYYWAYSTWGWWNTLFARNWWTYHHYLMPATSNSWTLGNVGFYNGAWYPSNTVLSLGNWYNIVIVKSWTNEKIYINSELVMDSNSSFDNNSRPIWMIANYQAWQTQGAQWRMSELIFEQWNWDATKVKKYFNSTKKKFFGSISDYQELEYIESDWNARINTQIRAWDVTKINIDLSDIYQWSSYADSYSYVVFGTTGNSWRMSSTYYTYNWARFRYHLWDWTKRYFDCNATQTWVKNSIEYLPSSFTVNWNSWTQVGTDSWWADASNGSICIWHCWNNSYSKYKLYYLKITEKWVEHEYMPAQRKSDWVLWLYDKTTGIFYINAGWWNFTAWPRIWITLSSSSLSLTQAWQTAQLTVTPNPASVWAQWYQWRSSDTTIATVNSSGLVTCVTPGECVITCTAVATWDTDTCSIVTVEEYVLLSEWWSVNKFSELSQASNNTSPAIRNNTTNWIWQSLQTDRNTAMYKVFDKEIVWFDVIFQLTETYNYEWMSFHLQSNTWTAWVDANSLTINTDNEQRAWRYWVCYWVDWTLIFSSWSTTRDNVRVVWEKNWNTRTITVSWWASFTKTFTTSDAYKSIMFSSWRWYTSNNIWNYSKAIVYLK